MSQRLPSPFALYNDVNVSRPQHFHIHLLRERRGEKVKPCQVKSFRDHKIPSTEPGVPGNSKFCFKEPCDLIFKL